MNDEIRDALIKDKTIDIVTTGAKTGMSRTTEIWFWNISGRIIICGTASADGTNGRRFYRDWLANLITNPDFVFVLKESLAAELPARAVAIVDAEDRRRIMSAPESK